MSAVANFVAFRSAFPSRKQQQESLYPRPLDFPSFEVRLLTLLPPDHGNENDDGLVYCSLKYESLIERYDEKTGDTIPIPEYVALSYCWGDPLVTRPIYVNNIYVEVTTNLEAALRALRDMKINVLWIDALCINQGDLLERGLQVMRMGLIYSNAIKVLAWIGDDYYSERAMNYLHVEARAQAQGGVGKNIHISEYHAKSVSALLRRPYWKRVWVIQEISKGREVHVVCGSQSMEWNSLHAIIQRLDFEGCKEVIALNYFRQAERNRKRPLFHQALSESKGFLATDSRDKIYGILGLTSDGSDLVPAPNYHQPVASVYFQLFKRLLSEHQDFSYLVRPRGLWELPDPSLLLPEPDWINLESGISLWILLVLSKQQSRELPIRGRLNYWVPPRLRVFSSLPLNDSIFPGLNGRGYSMENKEGLPLISRNGLHTTIYIIDVIGSTASNFLRTDSMDPFPQASNICTSEKTIRDAISFLNQAPLPAKPSHVLKSLCQVLFCSLSSDFEFKGPRAFEDLLLADTVVEMDLGRPGQTMGRPPIGTLPPRRCFQEWLSENQDLCILGWTLLTWIWLHCATSGFLSGYDLSRLRYDILDRTIGSFGKKKLDAIKALDDAINSAALKGMKIAVGQKRQIPGLVPVNARRGDLIALMPHSNVPVVLRLVEGGTVHFIGETCIYIYGPPISLQGYSREQNWGLHEDWNISNDVWFPIGFKNKENWKQMRII